MSKKKNTRIEIIEQLKNKKAFSYNEMKRRFKSMQHRIVIPPLVVERFLEWFNNDLIYSYAQDVKNIENWKYLPEINCNEKYEIKGETYVVDNVKITNVISNKDYIVAVCFVKADGTGFSECVENVIGNDIFKKIP